MGTRPIVYNTKEMQRILEGNGFKLSRQSGDHFIYTDGKRTVSINYRINKKPSQPTLMCFEMAFLYLILSLYKTVMVSQEGFEPPTPGLEGLCSIQLSY